MAVMGQILAYLYLFVYSFSDSHLVFQKKINRVNKHHHHIVKEFVFTYKFYLQEYQTFI